jgi:hypothetical protein
MMTVAAGVESIPIISFLTSVFQFGIGSWLFLHWPRIGRWITIILGVGMLVWPLFAIPWIIQDGNVWGYVFYGLPIILTALVVYGHIRNFKNKERPSILIRVLLTVFPCGLFISYLIYLGILINKGQLTFG